MNVVYFVAGNPQYIEYLKLSISSVRKAMPHAEIHVFTDIDADLPGVTKWLQIGGYSNPLMVENTIIWRDFCAAHEGVNIFLDPDVLMAKAPPLFLADIAVTWRDNLGDFSRRMPYNTGVVVARGGQKSALFFNEMTDRISAMSDEDQKWYGNQIALAEMLGEPPQQMVDGWKHARKVNWTPSLHCGCNVSFLPCDKFNWTPEDDGPVMDRYFVHLKGNRKHRMKSLHDQLVAV